MHNVLTQLLNRFTRSILIMLLLCITGLSICGCTQLSGFSKLPVSREEAYSAASKWYNMDSSIHSNIPFDERPIPTLDDASAAKILDQVRADVEANASGEVLIADYQKLEALIERLETDFSIAQIHHDRDITDKKIEDLCDELEEHIIEVNDATLLILRAAIESKHGEELADYIADDKKVKTLKEYGGLSATAKENLKKVTDLVHEYELEMLEAAVVTDEGEELIIDDITDEYYNDEITYDEAIEKYACYWKTKNAKIAQIYLELVKLRNEIAVMDGYDNYAIKGYKDNGRDFTIDDIQSVYADVKEYIVPLEAYIDSLLYWDEELGNMRFGAEERLDRTEAVISKINPALMNSWYYMRDNHLYDIDYSDKKNDVGYTIRLRTYGDAFFFDSPYGSSDDLYTVVHEFGHYNRMFNSKGNVFDDFSPDVEEVFSQSLELLSIDYADEMFGVEHAYVAQLGKLSDILNAVIEGCIQDEFQVAVYTYEGELDVPTINHIYQQVASEYGTDYSSDSGEIYEWIEVNHNFEQPMYYLAYATSGLAALDLFSLSRDDMDTAMDVYMNMTTCKSNTSYRELINEAGLPDIFEKGTIKEISANVEKHVQEQYEEELRYQRLSYVIIAVVAVIIISLIICVIVYIIKRRKAFKEKNAASGQLEEENEEKEDNK